MLIVLDTNVLVSAILTPAGRPAWLVSQVMAGSFKLCLDYRIVQEYREVLLRPKFDLSAQFVDCFLDNLTGDALFVTALPIDSIPFIDDSDRKFFEVAKYCQASLITGNLKHFPQDPLVSGVSEFCSRFVN